MPNGSMALSLLAAVETLRISLPTVIEAQLGWVTRPVCNHRLKAWGQRLVHHSGVLLEIRGLQHATGESPAVMMSNHQSNFDVPILYHAFPGTLRMVAKTELFKIPVFGQAMRAAEFIEVERGNRERALASLALARKKLESGISVWIAPEGTRSKDGTLGTFKTGGFLLAIETGLPILPVTVVGTRNVLPPGSARIVPGQRVTVTFHPKVQAVEFGTAKRRDLMRVVRAAIASGLPA